jgi:hypothetical protein
MKHNATDRSRSHLNSGEDLYRRVRAGFVANGTSLRAFCIANHVFPQNARDCLLGIWRGPRAQALRRQLMQASKAASDD